MPLRSALSALLVLAVAAGCGSAQPRVYEAGSASAATRVDGDARDWRGALFPVPEEAGLTFGVRQAGDDLLVAVVAGDERQARRIALGGLYLSLDPAGAEAEGLRLRFPSPAPPDPADLRSQRGTPHPLRLRERFRRTDDRVEIRRAGGVVVRSIDPARVPGLETATRWTDDALVVEMRVPLEAREDLLAVAPGDRLGVGIGLVDLPGFDARIGGERRRPTPGGRAETPELDVTTRWFVVDLAD